MGLVYSRGEQEADKEQLCAGVVRKLDKKIGSFFYFLTRLPLADVSATRCRSRSVTNLCTPGRDDRDRLFVHGLSLNFDVAVRVISSACK